MLDERLKMIGNLKNFKPFCGLVIASLLLAACTDYESMIEEDFQAHMLDSRDGNVYDVVTIGSQTWMAQNLNYETPNSTCYKENPSYCDKYGRLYSWDAAMVACPAGWHLPTSDEWNDLFSVVGSSYSGYVLKSTSGWKDDGNGRDAFGFKVLPAGMGGDYLGENALFWTSTESKNGGSRAISVDFSYDYDGSFIGESFYVYKYSVRCVKD